MILFITLSASNSKLTNESVSIVLILHSVIIPLSSNLSIVLINQIKETNLSILFKTYGITAR
jgi:hypothetical protein